MFTRFWQVTVDGPTADGSLVGGSCGRWRPLDAPPVTGGWQSLPARL